MEYSRYNSSRDFPFHKRIMNSLETMIENMILLQDLLIEDEHGAGYGRALEVDVNLSSPHLINGWLFSDKCEQPLFEL